jgi:hypothetical protein
LLVWGFCLNLPLKSDWLSTWKHKYVYHLSPLPVFMTDRDEVCSLWGR